MSAEPQNEPIKRVRTSDAERERVAEALRNAVTEGRLSLDEGDQRLATLYATKYRDELPPLLADLPTDDGWMGGSGAPRSSRRGRGWSPGAANQGPSADHNPANSQGGPVWGPPWARGWGQPAEPGTAPTAGPETGPAGGSPWGPGWGGFDPSMWRRRRVFRTVRLAVVAAILITFFAFTGHFFWPIIPLFFLFNLVRFGVWHRGWHHGCRDLHAGSNPGWHP